MVLNPELEIDFLPYSSVIYIELIERSKTVDGVVKSNEFTVKTSYNGKPLKTCMKSDANGECSSKDFIEHIEKQFYTDYGQIKQLCD